MFGKYGAIVIANADAVWPIAPESAGVLSRLTELISGHHKVLLGCSLVAVNLATSKYATYRALRMAEIDTVPTYTVADWSQDSSNFWVAKPDDGVGCGGSGYFESSAALLDWITQGREHTPYHSAIPGRRSHKYFPYYANKVALGS